MQESLDWEGVSRADTRRSHRDGVGAAQHSQGDVTFMGRGSNKGGGMPCFCRREEVMSLF